VHQFVAGEELIDTDHFEQNLENFSLFIDIEFDSDHPAESYIQFVGEWGDIFDQTTDVLHGNHRSQREKLLDLQKEDILADS